MKNTTHYCAGPAITGCITGITVQNKPAAVAPKTITHHFLRFWNWAKKTVDAAKICGSAMLNRNPANIRKWIAPVLLLCYAPLGLILLTIIA